MQIYKLSKPTPYVQDEWCHYCHRLGSLRESRRMVSRRTSRRTSERPSLLPILLLVVGFFAVLDQADGFMFPTTVVIGVIVAV